MNQNRLPQNIPSLLIFILLAGCAQHSEHASNDHDGAQSVASTQPGDRDAGIASSDDSLPLIKKLNCRFLPNPVQVHRHVISGGLPEGPEAFQELAELGVRTVISVDGAKPNVATAKRFGLRYVHLPHGYDGIPEQRAQQLAKAIRDLQGPIYVHCHHGKHRSPAAASVACVGAGLLAPSAAVSVLELAGTSLHYRGLYSAAAAAQVLDSERLDRLQVTFQEIVAVPPLAEAMVHLEHTHHRLQQIADASWTPPATHPDFDPAHQALLLRELFTEMLRTPDVQQHPTAFQQLLKDSETAARSLETHLRESRPSGHPQTMEGLTSLLNSITQNCKTCHMQYRDVPLGEK